METDKKLKLDAKIVTWKYGLTLNFDHFMQVQGHWKKNSASTTFPNWNTQNNCLLQFFTSYPYICDTI